VIKGIDDLSTIGCFALTELGYGNNAVEMETTSTYDSKTKGLLLKLQNLLFIPPLFYPKNTG
jgi:acyl-CoA oxidase